MLKIRQPTDKGQDYIRLERFSEDVSVVIEPSSNSDNLIIAEFRDDGDIFIRSMGKDIKKVGRWKE